MGRSYIISFDLYPIKKNLRIAQDCLSNYLYILPHFLAQVKYYFCPGDPQDAPRAFKQTKKSFIRV
jgi:hypothetical protein